MSKSVKVAPPAVFAYLLNEIQKNGATESNLYFLVGILVSIFSLAVGGWFFHAPSRIMERSIGYKVDRYFKKYLYNAVFHLPLTWHTDHDSGDTIDKINKATDSMFQFSRGTFIVLNVIIKIIATTAILIYFSLWMAVIAWIFFIITLTVIIKFDNILSPQYKELNVMDNKAQAKVYDGVSNITTVKVLSIEPQILEGIKGSWWLSYKMYMKNKILVECKWFSGSVFFDLLIFLPIIFYIVYNVKIGGVILVGTISAMYMYLKDFQDVYYNIAGSYDDISIQKSRILGVKEIEDNYKKISKVKKKNFKGWEVLRVENLKFKYDENLESHSLDIENLEVRKGEKIALIGESGSGKSTILKVLHGMYERASANVEVGGKSFKTNFVDMNLYSTLVPQEPEVFSASIKENITLLLNFSDNEIESATKMAEFYDVAQGLPKGFDSVVNEKGVNLSGGQKQRLALSRALLFSAEKEIILLDESTSSVDPVNEVKIYKNIFENFPGVTILASIHKMNLLKYFDRIIILENGKIKIHGTFDYLLVHDSEFRLAWDEFVKENA
jgi:ABC-type multidrug transport system fused ATPase/permease subunit